MHVCGPAQRGEAARTPPSRDRGAGPLPLDMSDADLRTPSAGSDRGARRGQRAPDRLLADPKPQADLHQTQPAGVQLDGFGEVALIETAPADRDRTVKSQEVV